MRRGRPFPKRTPFLIGCEGEGEHAFVRFLNILCDEAGLHVHLEAKSQGGGGSVNVVTRTGRWLQKNRARQDYRARLILLDRDRIEIDPREGKAVQAAAARFNLEIVFQDPNQEGLLLRLHEGQKRRQVTAREAGRLLRKEWPDYRKPPTAEQLRERFTLADVRRAATHDQQLQRLLSIIGL